MAQAANMGGLFAVVDLDTRKALQDVRRLQTEFAKIFRPPAGPPPFNRERLEAKKASDAMREAAKSATAVGTNIKKSGDEAVTAGKKVKQLGDGFHGVAQNAGNLFTSLSLATRRGGGIGAFSNTLRTTSSLFRGAAGAGAAFGITVAGITLAVVGGVVALKAYTTALSKLLRTALTQGESLETLLVSFEALLGSKAKAVDEFNFIIESAKVSPFFTDAIVQLDRFLLAQGLLDTGLRRGIGQGLIQFGSAAGLTGDKLQDLAYALGQVYNAGRLTGDEARQLRNNFLGAENVLRTLPRYAENTGLELKKAMESGSISSADFFEAFLAYTAKFEGAALAQQQTLRGLKDTIQDVFQLGLGQATVELAEINASFSALAAIRDPLSDLLTIIEDIDFAPLAGALGSIVSNAVEPLANFVSSGNAGRVNLFFRKTLPEAIYATSQSFFLLLNTVYVFYRGAFQVFTAFRNILFGAGTSVNSFTSLVQLGFRTAAVGVALGTHAMIVGLSPLVAVLVAVASGVIGFGRVIVAVFQQIASLLGGSGFSFGAVFDTAIDQVKTGWDAITDVFKTGAKVVKDAYDAAKRPIEQLPNFLFPTPEFIQPDITPVITGTGGADSGGAGGAKKTAAEIAKGMNSLFDMLERWAGLRSDLEVGFLGKEGFSATAEQIAAQGKKVVEALESIGGAKAVKVADLVFKATLKLMKLAELREATATALKDAEKKLADILSERDKFATSIADTAKKFALALSTETTVQKKLENFSSRGFFYETEISKQASFLESLRTRSQALVEFRKGIDALSKAGLDPQLIAELASAGPDAAGAAVSELANAGPAVIEEVNGLFTEINKNAEALGEGVAGSLFDASIGAAQAVVDGLTSDLAAIEAAAIAITETVYKALKPFAKKMEETGAAAGGAVADGISAAIPDVSTAMGSMGKTMGDSFQKFLGSRAAFSSSLLGGFAKMGVDLVSSFTATFAKVLQAWEKFKEGFGLEIGNFPAKIAKWFQNASKSPFVSAVIEWWNGKTGFWGLFKILFAGLGTLFIWGIENALRAAVGAFIKIPTIPLELPLRAVGDKFYNSMVDAINSFIRAINGFKFLGVPLLTHPIPLMQRKSGGGSVSDSWSNTLPPPTSISSSTAPSTTSSPLSVTVYLGDTEIKQVLATMITDENTRTATSLATGNRVA